MNLQRAYFAVGAIIPRRILNVVKEHQLRMETETDVKANNQDSIGANFVLSLIKLVPLASDKNPNFKC